MSINLTEQERSFLKRVGLSIQSVFDATKLSRSVYGRLMKARGKIVATGVTPCKAHGHRLRDSHGHCVMCNPSCLTHAKRHYTAAYVYVAYSACARLLKIGYTETLDDRIRQMNLHKLANANDWILCKAEFCENAGCVEAEVHRALCKYKLETVYGAKQGLSKEVFRCGRKTAINALNKTVRASERALEDYCHDIT